MTRRQERGKFSWLYSPWCVFWDSSAKATASNTNMSIQLFIQHILVKNHSPWQSGHSTSQEKLKTQMEWMYDISLSLQTKYKLDFLIYHNDISLYFILQTVPGLDNYYIFQICIKCRMKRAKEKHPAPH